MDVANNAAQALHFFLCEHLQSVIAAFFSAGILLTVPDTRAGLILGVTINIYNDLLPRSEGGLPMLVFMSGLAKARVTAYLLYAIPALYILVNLSRSQAPGVALKKIMVTIIFTTELTANTATSDLQTVHFNSFVGKYI